jgi:hypothetical protein
MTDPLYLPAVIQGAVVFIFSACAFVASGSLIALAMALFGTFAVVVFWMALFTSRPTSVVELWIETAYGIDRLR